MRVQSPRATVDGRVELTAVDGIREFVRGTSTGIEQSWVLDGPPRGSGDFLVRVAARGLDFVEASDTGLLFRDARSERGVRYGHATWIDADGRRTEIRASYAAGTIELRVPRDVVETGRYPVVLDPVVSSESTSLDKPHPLPTNGGIQVDQAIAFGGGVYLVVWSDFRGALFAARLSEAGTLLDPLGIQLTRAARSPTDATPRIASDGERFLVVWTHQGDIHGTFVSTTGMAEPTNALVIDAEASAQRDPDVAFDGTNFVVVWTDTRSGYLTPDIYGARVSGSTGSVLDLTSRPIVTATGGQRSPRIACTAAQSCLVAYGDATATGRLGIVLVDGTLDVTSSSFVGAASGNSVGSIDVDFDGTEYLIAWVTVSNSQVFAVRGIHVDAAGSLVETTEFDVGTHGTIPFGPVGVAARPGGFDVAWVAAYVQATENGPLWEVRGAVVPPASPPPSPEESVLAQGYDQTSLALAGSGSTVMLVWSPGVSTRSNAASDDASRTYDLRSTLLSPTLVPSSPDGIRVATSSSRHHHPAVASDGTTYLVVYQDDRSGDEDLYGVRVDASGAPLDAQAFVVVSAPGDQVDPAVVYTGGSYVVVWADSRDGDFDIRRTVVFPDGFVPPIDEAVTDTTTHEEHPALSAGPTGVVAAWQNSVAASDVRLEARVLQLTKGQPDAATLVVATAAGTVEACPTLASSPEGHLVAWLEGMPYGSGTGVYARRFAADGALLDATPIAIEADPSTFPDCPRAAYATDYLVAFPAAVGSSSGTQGVLVRPSDGSTRAPAAGGAIAEYPSYMGQYRPSFGLVFDGARYLLTFTRVADPAHEGALFGRVLTPDGAPVGSSPFPIEIAGDAVITSAAATDGRRRALVAYTRLTHEPPTLSGVRAHVRRVSMDSLAGASCASDAECETGHCVDGVCCDTSCGNGSTSDCLACSVAAGAPSDGTCAAVLATAEVVCRPATSSCDGIEICQGETDCPADAFAPNDTWCDDGLSCNGADACREGTCTPSLATPCSDESVARPHTQLCSFAPPRGRPSDSLGVLALVIAAAFIARRWSARRRS